MILRKRVSWLAGVLLVAASMAGCRTSSIGSELRPVVGTVSEQGKQVDKLGQIFSSSRYQLTGVAVSRRGRLFVNFPRWDAAAGSYAMAVGEVLDADSVKPYPPAPDANTAADWNRFNPDPRTPPAGDCFVCVQSVHVDGRDRLWVLDPASPLMAGVVRGPGGGPKLVEIDLNTDRVVRTIRFDEKIAPANSYLNDLRVELRAEGDTLYITDSGAGAIVVVDVATGAARRVLAGDPSTKADPMFVPIVGGRELRGKDGKVPQVHADGIALDQSRGVLYWQALTNKRLYGCSTTMLRDASLTEYELSSAVKDLGLTVMTDGMACDADGLLYFSALERDAIVVRTLDGVMHTLASDAAIAWPDSFAMAYGRMPGARKPEPLVVFTTAQIHRSKMFSPDGSSPREPYRVLAAPAARKRK